MIFKKVKKKLLGREERIISKFAWFPTIFKRSNSTTELKTFIWFEKYYILQDVRYKRNEYTWKDSKIFSNSSELNINELNKMLDSLDSKDRALVHGIIDNHIIAD